MSECATGKYFVPESGLNRSSSEPDVFAFSTQNIRQRTCSNTSNYGSLQRRRKNSKISGNGGDKTDTSQIELVQAMNSNERTGSDYSVGHVTLTEPLNNLTPLTPTREEVKALACDRLQEELRKAQQDLKLRDEECEKLSRVRTELESELEDLTASLFQEAHAMVHQAKVKQAAAEKRLLEANNQVDVLQAEVSALKSLVITTPSMPGGWRRHSAENLVPCIECGQYDCNGASGSANRIVSCARKHEPGAFDKQEVDVILFREFLEWMDERSVSDDQPFLARIYREDVAPCLAFPNEELALKIHAAIENNTLMMEAIQNKAVFRKCALSGTTRMCSHKVKLLEKGDWYFLCRSSRDRIASVCDFYMYVRYIQGGLVKADVTEIYWELMRLRSQMAFARLGLTSKNQRPKSP